MSANSKDNNPNVVALNALYQNSKNAAESIDFLIPKVKNMDLKKDLAAQMLGHHSFVKNSATKLHEIHHYPEEPILGTISATASTWLKSAVDPSDSHVAEMIIENATCGMIEIQKSMNAANNLTFDVEQIGGEAIAFQQANINKMRGYL